MSKQVAIVGAGLAGLACALRLKQRGVQARIFEATDRVGGRVTTDEHEGFLLDRGFQVLLTAYPEARRLLDYQALDLRSFRPGAKIFKARKLWTLSDPLRNPANALPTLFCPVGTLADKPRILRLRARVTGPSLQELLQKPETTTRARLQEDCFSDEITAQFFRPFLGGIFLENELATSSRKFEFVFRMFAQGSAALPNHGMGAIPKQLAVRLGGERIEFRREVVALEAGAIRFTDGTCMEAPTIVLATDPWTTGRLLGSARPAASPVACLYFAADTTPVRGPWLVLNGESRGPINNVTVPSEVQLSYAPAGKSLISITVIDPDAAEDEHLESAVRLQLTQWFGPQAKDWRHLRTYRIPRPIPLQIPPALQPVGKPAKLAEGIYQCSDAQWIASIEGALRSGVQAADEIAG
ncbi:MAG: FAD-dependent oxidoreductase [Acidobacteriaceae bacterium]|nr:FAD-dependent oxidoreductase [Acidobacteriaceae bacterium]